MLKTKTFSLIILSFLFFGSVNGQKLKNLSNNTLGSNVQHAGRILDVKYVPEHKIYLVAGDFISFNGQSSQNFVVLDSNLVAITTMGLDSCTGPINTIEYLIDPLNPDSLTIWLGGAFNRVRLKGASQGFNRLLFSEIGIKRTSTYNYTSGLKATNPIFDGTVINDIEYVTFSSTKRLLVGGDFIDVTVSDASSTILPMNGLKLFSMNYSFASRNRIVPTSNIFSSIVYSIEEIPNSNGKFCFSNSKNYLTYVSQVTTLTQLSVLNHNTIGGTVYRNYNSPRLIKEKNSIYRNDQFHLVAFEGGSPNEQRRTSFSIGNILPYATNLAIHTEDFYPNNFQYYNGNFYSSSCYINDYTAPNRYYPTILTLSKFDTLGNRNQFAYLGSGGNFDNDYDSTLLYKQDELFIAGKYLFYAKTNLTGVSTEYTVDGLFGSRQSQGTSTTPSIIALGTPVSTRSKMAIYCLEPSNAKNFINPDTLICSGNQKTYTIPSAEFATAYKWNYTGDLSKLKVKTTLAGVYSTFSGTISSFTPNLYVEVQDGFNGGTLSVIPYNFCNTTTDTLFSKAITIQLYPAPLPNLSIPTATTLNCNQDSVTLTPSSSTSNVVFTWFDENNNSLSGLSQTLTLNDINPITNSETLYLEVQESTGNQCKLRDTVLVYKDIREPNLVLDSNPLMFGIWNCYTDSILVGVVDTNSLGTSLTLDTYFYQGTDTVFSTSGYVYSSSLIEFTAKYQETGCSQTISTSLNEDITPPASNQIFASVDGVQSVFIGLDVLNCSNDSSLLVLSDTANYDTYWIFNNDTIQDSLILSINHPLFVGFPDSLASTQNYSFYYYAFNPSNGCSNVFPTVLSFEVKKPVFATDFVGDSTLNCSETELTLIYPPTLSLLNRGWLVSGFNSSNDSLTIINAGEQVYEIIGLNGCKNYDTITVVQTNELSFAPMEDRFVCPDIPFSITAQTLGNETYSYLWNGITSGATFTGTGGIDSLLVVSTTNGTGCSGLDTIRVQITAPISATFSGYSECGDNISIQVSSVTGGASASLNDYEFRFNDELVFSPFSGTLPNYSVDTFALFPLWIKDSLGCEYEFQTEVTGQILKPTSEFLVSTYNQSLDTLYIANVNQYTGFDFVTWTSTNSQVQWINIYDSAALFTYQDTGWVEIVFTGFILDTNLNTGLIDTCLYPSSKWIYFGEFEVIWDDTANIGINSASLSPSLTSNGSATINLNVTFGSAQDYQVYTTTALGARIDALSFSDSAQSVGTVTHQLTLPSLAVGVYYVNILSKYGGIQLTLTIQ